MDLAMVNHTMMNHSMSDMNSTMSTMNPYHGDMHHTTMAAGHGDHTTMAAGHGAGHGAGSGSLEGGEHDMMMMNMFFTIAWEGSYVLFKQLKLEKWWHLLLACVIIGIVAALYEGLKVLREHLLLKYAPQSVQISSNGYAESSKDDIVVTQPSNISVRMCSAIHFLQTFLHMIQVTVSYLLMLVFMTFNVWLCISVVLGAGLGYFIFGWKKAVIVDSNEHCH